jgi:hypothetical protein
MGRRVNAPVRLVQGLRTESASADKDWKERFEFVQRVHRMQKSQRNEQWLRFLVSKHMK